MQFERDGKPAFVAALDQPLAFLEQFHVPSSDGELLPEMADFEVGRDRLGEDPDAGDPQVELRGQQLGSRRECGVPDAAPEIGFVGKVRAQGIGRETQPVGQREIKAQVLELRTDRGVRGQVEGLGREARSDRGQDRRVDQPGPRSGLLDPGYRFRDGEVGVEYRFDHLVERGIGERPPPLPRVAGAAGRTLGKVGGQLRSRFLRQVGRTSRPQGAAAVRQEYKSPAEQDRRRKNAIPQAHRDILPSPMSRVYSRESGSGNERGRRSRAVTSRQRPPRGACQAPRTALPSQGRS